MRLRATLERMSSPHRDESESLRRRVAVLRQQNAKLELEVLTREPVSVPESKTRILLLVLACIAAPLPAGCAGCATGFVNPAGPCPS